jgi:hypothetical protein
VTSPLGRQQSEPFLIFTSLKPVDAHYRKPFEVVALQELALEVAVSSGARHLHVASNHAGVSHGWTTLSDAAICKKPQMYEISQIHISLCSCFSNASGGL